MHTYILLFGFDDVAQRTIRAALEKSSATSSLPSPPLVSIVICACGCTLRFANAGNATQCTQSVYVFRHEMCMHTVLVRISWMRGVLPPVCVCLCVCAVDRELPIRSFVNSVFVYVGRVRRFGHCSAALPVVFHTINMSMRSNVKKEREKKTTQTQHESHLFVCMCLCSGINIRDVCVGFQLITAVRDGLCSCQNYFFC